MDKKVAKQKILNTALQSIYLDGIRATKVDNIAASLGISKRTLYELYPSKSDLMLACVQQMQAEWDEQLRAMKASFSKEEALALIWRFIEFFIESLYQTHLSFWEDLMKDEQLKEWRATAKTDWLKQCASLIKTCQQEGFLLKSLNPSLLSDRMLTGIFQSRIDNCSFEQLYVYSYILIRGASTPEGIRYFDKIVDQSDGKKKEYPLLCR